LITLALTSPLRSSQIKHAVIVRQCP
jgi:hypothetical protein